MIESLIQMQAPGCFGAASVFSRDSDACKLCVAFTECADASIKTLQAIRGTIDVSDVLARHEAARLSAEAKRVAKALPVPLEGALPISQPKPIAAVVERKTSIVSVAFEVSQTDRSFVEGIANAKTRECVLRQLTQNMHNECRANLPKGVNPYATKGPSFLRVACDMFLRGPVTKASLNTALMKELKWKKGTASSHVSIAMNTLKHFKIVLETNDVFVLNPALADHHV